VNGETDNQLIVDLVNVDVTPNAKSWELDLVDQRIDIQCDAQVSESLIAIVNIHNSFSY